MKVGPSPSGIWFTGNSAAIINGEGSVLFNTTGLPAVTQQRTKTVLATNFDWDSWQEPAGNPYKMPEIHSEKVMEQSNITGGITEVMQYRTTLESDFTGDINFEGHCSNGYVLSTYDPNGNNRRFIGSVSNHLHYSCPFSFQVQGVSLMKGEILEFFSITFGFHNLIKTASGPHQKGLQSVDLDKERLMNWTQRPYSSGEFLKLATGAGNWNGSPGKTTMPLMWLKTEFELTANDLAGDKVGFVFDATGLARGHLHVNGFDVGRYWDIVRNDHSGQPTQRYYHIPRDVLKEGKNLLVIFDTLGATDTTKPAIVKTKVTNGPSQIVADLPCVQ